MESTLSRCVLALSVLALPDAGKNTKLNAPLATTFSAWFMTPPVASPDGKVQVYTADRDGDQDLELYAVLSSGRQPPVRLLEPVLAGVEHRFTLDGSSVLFVGDLDGNGSFELLRGPVDGSAAPAPLSGAQDGVNWFRPTRDGTRVLYLSVHPFVPDGGYVAELFSVSLDGGTRLKLNGPLAPGGNVRTAKLAGTDLTVYSADQDTPGQVELFVVPVDGSAPARKLPIPLVVGSSVRDFQLDPQGSLVLYLADQEEYGRLELFSIPIDGGQLPRKLNGPLVPGGYVGALTPLTPYGSSAFHVSFDGRWVVYAANQDSLESVEIYGVPADGSRQAVKLSANPDRGAYVWALTYDSARVIYGDTSGREIFSVPIDGSLPARRIAGPMAGWIHSAPSVSFDSRYVVYTASQDAYDVSELYSVPVDGSAPPVKLNAPLPAGGEVFRGSTFFGPGFWVLEGGVVYRAEQEQDGRLELYLVPVEGGAPPRKLASSLGGFIQPSVSNADPHPAHPLPAYFDEIVFARTGELFLVGFDASRPVVLDELPQDNVFGDVKEFDLAPGGDRVVYTAPEQGDPPEVDSVPTGDPDGRVEIRVDTQALEVEHPKLVPEGSRVVFLVRRLGLEWEVEYDLYSAPDDGGPEPIELDAALGASASVQSFLVAPQGQQLVFLASVADHYALFSVPVDGSAAPVLLHESPAGSGLSPGRVSADGRVVGFLQDGGLHTVPIDGSVPASFVMSAVDYRFQLTRDGSQVVFQRSLGLHELYVAPTDGSSTPRRLSAAIERVQNFELAPDSVQAVYSARRNWGYRSELYSARIDGSTPPVRLHPELDADRDVSAGFRISSDSQRVVYRADALVDEQVELFSVLVDGSRQPVRLNGALVHGGDVVDFRISPDDERVVYSADQQSDGVVELFSTPIHGARMPVRLSRPLLPGGGVRSFEISADSSAVVFTAERSRVGLPRDYPLSLLSAPITGVEKAIEIAGPWSSPYAGSVRDYRLNADASVVVYRADQDEPGVIELYAARREFAEAKPAMKR